MASWCLPSCSRSWPALQQQQEGGRGWSRAGSGRKRQEAGRDRRGQVGCSLVELLRADQPIVVLGAQQGVVGVLRLAGHAQHVVPLVDLAIHPAGRSRS